VGSLSLQDIKGHFESDKRRFDDIQKQSLRQKEQEMTDELQMMKREREVLYQKKTNDEQVMLDLVNELKNRKDRELRA
jgi:hypothetical protein